MDEKANILNSWIGRTIICSDRRFTYEEAQETIENGEGDFKEEIHLLNDLAQKLRAKRFDKGAIDFERVEVKFEIDEKGKPTRVFFKESKEANKLIEEFMLLANKKVAEFIGRVPKGKNAKTFVYRTHDKPSLDKLNSFNQFIRKFGYGIKTANTKAISSSMNQLLHDVKGKNIENLVETLAIRSMSKAEYTTENIGHYGLHFDFYTHFTSPIRRYPDMMVHRLLQKYLDEGRSVNAEKYEDKCKHSSEMEQRAANAERASIKYKQVEFMQDKIGMDFPGTISGVTEWGFYVELEDNKCEGMVSIRELEDDFYEFDEDNYCIVGRYHRKIYQLGDSVKIRVTSANLAAKQLDFVLSEEETAQIN
jgi:ribonuclease R